MDKICKNCKSWDRDEDNKDCKDIGFECMEQIRAGKGICLKAVFACIDEKNESLMVTLDASDRAERELNTLVYANALLLTKPQFGCILFEEK